MSLFRSLAPVSAAPLRRRLVPFVLGLGALFVGLGPLHAAPATCSITGVTVTRAEPATPVEMEDQVTLVGTGFADLACTDPNKPLILFLDRLPLADVHGVYIGPDRFRFTLLRGPDSKAAWDAILGRPHLGAKTVAVSLGFPDGHPAESAAVLRLVALPKAWFGGGVAVFLGLALLFHRLAVTTTILRGPPPDTTKPDEKGAYSLSKTQAAWWFFVVLGAYLFIGLVTGDFSTSLNATALALLAIGGGTAIGGALIGQAQNDSPQNQLATQQARRQATQDVAALTQSVAETADATPPQRATEQAKLAAARRTKAVLANLSQGFLVDILSDADGICFHRFQIVAWTVVLSGVFADGVYENLAMPDFDSTLLGLMALSSGTYLGLKNTEAVVPKVPSAA